MNDISLRDISIKIVELKGSVETQKNKKNY